MIDREVYLIGGGASLKDFDFNKVKNKDTIVINNAIFYVPNPTYFITMDYIFYKCRLRFSQRIEEFKRISVPKIFISNIDNPNIKEKDGRIVDISTGKGDMYYNLEAFNVIIKSNRIDGIGTEWNDFRHGNHSGYCSLQLAILLGYKTINLLGFDYQISHGNTHFHEGYNQGLCKFNMLLNRYSKFFYMALKEIKQKLPDIQIYNYSDISVFRNILPTKNLEDIKNE